VCDNRISTNQISFGKVGRDYLSAHPEHAFKMLNPLDIKLPNIMPSAVVIWLDRDVEQQARSQAKFVHLTMGFPMATRAYLRQWAATLRHDRAPALATLRDWPRLYLSFEGIIRKPDTAAADIARFLSPWWGGLDTARMAAVVLPRPTDCTPGIAIEEAAVERHAE
jgi:hypothetical protein